MYRRASGEESYELPGLWFSPAELQSLAVMQRILRDLGGGLLADQVSAIAKRLNQLVQHRRLNLGEAAARIRFPGVASRTTGEAFQVAASATLQRRKLWFEYHSRGSNRQSERTVSPQRLTHYREVWYLDAWDEESNELRTFSLDRLRRAKVLEDSRARSPRCRPRQSLRERLRHLRRQGGQGRGAAFLSRARAMGCGRELASGAGGQVRCRTAATNCASHIGMRASS